ncbi:GNAT family N-acetyltransferase [Streptomyces sp. CJ_13]|uniref:GNAT family N-acetyltransferase n=1 Tax=Streptomyces sp. CJ_13 TaxID=2724943 RepID=UPI001BDBD676|nr:GNAT family N-acetyltransferase [Streptomyces sp. CJ_13]MBT1188431.1 GNAT family N-acetyltransferase [Streptomyces sp. CJ_13]
MPAEVTYERYEGQEPTDQLDTFLPAYEEVYAEPPYSEGPSDVRQFIDHYLLHAERPGMRLVIAREGDEVIGFTYGYYLPANTGWWGNVDRPLPADFTHEDGTRTWVILELAVRKPWRRQGVAAALHAALLDGLDVDRVTLTVRPEPEAAAAQAAYEAWGYREVGISHPWEEAPLYKAMVLELAPARSRTDRASRGAA